jgi:hypothetical protein
LEDDDDLMDLKQAVNKEKRKPTKSLAQIKAEMNIM